MNWKYLFIVWGVGITIVVGVLWFAGTRFGVVSSISTSDTLNTTRLAVNDLITLVTNFSTTTANAYTTTSTTTYAGGLYATRIAAPYFNATSTTATSTFKNGIDLTGGCLSFVGTCLQAITFGLGDANIWTALQRFQAGASSTLLTAFGAFWAPTSTDPVLSGAGQFAINTTQASTSLRWHDGTAERAVNDAVWRTITIASSTIQQFGGTSSATGTIPMGLSGRGETFLKIKCFSDPSGRYTVRWGDSSNWMDTLQCGVGTTTEELIDADSFNDDDGTIANSSFSFLEPRYLQVSVHTVGSGGISFSILVRETAD